MKMVIRDYLPLLKEAIVEAKNAGFGPEVENLEKVLSTAFTTSSEMVQEHGLAIGRFLKDTRSGLPLSTKRKLEVCLNETELACTGWRKLFAMMKRPGKLC